MNPSAHPAPFAFGDLQGCHAPFKRLFKTLPLAPDTPVWLAGDLINRGPDSLATLRDVVALGQRAVAVLGNHDLHLLAVSAGIRTQRKSDTLADILAAPDAPDLLDWLRHRPFAHFEDGMLMVHAGVLRQSNLVDHARHELELLGEEPSTVEGYLKMIRIFADMGHSGGSASVFIPTLQELLWFKNLCPLTDNPDEWQSVDDNMWQNRRNGEAFSHDGGKHYYLLSDGSSSRNPGSQYESMHYLGSYEKTFERRSSEEV